ncbi:MAG: helix-turn-helix transcriptional regulator [Bacteroidetes bacterium]|nr:helix-turn-helix transcriptional regulator [Bacteroidota bacterium]
MKRESLQVIKRPNLLSVNERLEQTGLALEYFPAFEQRQHDYHTHEFIEMLFVIEGEFRHITADRTYDETAGGLTILNYRQFHSLRTPSGPVKLMNIYWNPMIFPMQDLPDQLTSRLHELIPLHPMLGHRLNRIQHLNIRNPDQVSFLLQLLLKEQQQERPGYDAVIQSLFRLILIEICRAAPAVHSAELDLSNPRMERVRNYLEKNYAEQIKLSQLCRLSGLHSANLCRQFKAYTGKSTGDYVKQRRLAAALQKLRISNEKILTICHDSGFTDISRFNRYFRNTFACTPSEYRKRYQTAHVLDTV